MLEGPTYPTNSIVNLNYLSWSLRVISSAIMLQTLFYKFGGHPDSIMLFTQLGAEPFGRYALGTVELVTSLLILWPRTTPLGALIGTILMSGALFAHIFIVGIVFNNDGGKLFLLALGCFLACLALCIIFRNQMISYARKRYTI